MKMAKFYFLVLMDPRKCMFLDVPIFQTIFESNFKRVL